MQGKRRRCAVVLLLLLVLVLALPPLASPCSSLVLLNKGNPFFGANYDNWFAPGLLFVNKRGVRKSGWGAGTTGKTASWVSRYGSVTISCVGYQFPWGGMNEAGLVFSTMALGETRPPVPDERPPLAGVFWWQYMLDTCATIEEVREAAKGTRIDETEDHYLACDRTGAVTVIECLDGRLVIRSGEDVPITALANAPYQRCLDHWTSKAAGPANAYDSLNRFTRLAAGLAEFKGAEAEKAVDHAFGMLAGVASSDTRWSFVCDTGAQVFYLKSYKNPRIRFVDLKKIDFSCGRATAMLDAHAGLTGDITGAFRDYSHDEVAAHLVKALAHFRPDIPPEFTARILALFESFPCEHGK